MSASLIIHRYGRLEPGDRIVLVATASAHRQAAFDACQFLIDWLKTKAPFGSWRKLEKGRNGSMRVQAMMLPRPDGSGPKREIERRNDRRTTMQYPRQDTTVPYGNNGMP